MEPGLVRRHLGKSRVDASNDGGKSFVLYVQLFIKRRVLSGDELKALAGAM